MVASGKTYHFKVAEIEPQRLDKYLTTVLPALSRSRIQSLIKAGQVQINEDIVTKASYILDSSCSLAVHVPPAEPAALVAEDIPLDIIYEDKNIIVINKPAGMVVHPAHGHASGTLVHALLAHDPFLEGIGGVQRPGIVHRLDRDTSGVLLVAKNEKSYHWLQKQFRERSVVKKYVALVDGHPPTPSGRIEIGIQRDHNNRKKMAVAYGDAGKFAVTEYRTLQEFKDHTLLEVRIYTGRTHQIRVHLAYLHCPVVADSVYGYKHSSLPINRQFLHAQSIYILLPGKKEPREFVADLPGDLQEILKNLW